MDTSGKELTAQDLWVLFEREYGTSSATSPQIPTGVKGVGPIDAFVNNWNSTSATQVRVLDYHEHALGSGANAQAVAYLELRIDEQHTVFGVGIDANIVSASLKAIQSGLQRVKRRPKSGENAQRCESANA
jgi:2-isopropylmalate synthase